MSLTARMMDIGWQYLTPDEKQIARAIESHKAWWWRNGQGLSRQAGMVPASRDGPGKPGWSRQAGMVPAGRDGPLPARLVAQAEGLFVPETPSAGAAPERVSGVAGLLASMGSPVLLHGDLHHENILAAVRLPWLAIDPKGLAG